MSTAPKIAPQHPFLNSEVILNFSNGVAETLQTMAGVSISFDKGFVEKNWKAKNDISVYLDLKSPPYTGQIRFHFNKVVLVTLFEKMLGQTVAPDSNELLDCLGEISNMCYGYSKAKLNEKGFALQMSIPRPSATKDLPEVFSRHPHIVIPFKVLEEQCHIQIIMF